MKLIKQLREHPSYTETRLDHCWILNDDATQENLNRYEINIRRIALDLKIQRVQAIRLLALDSRIREFELPKSNLGWEYRYRMKGTDVVGPTVDRLSEAKVSIEEDGVKGDSRFIIERRHPGEWEEVES